MNPDFRDILLALNDAQVEYMVVGAYAMAAHGLLRATGYIDLWVRATPENAVRVMAALAHFGAPLSQVSAADFATPGTVFQIGVIPRRVDILTSIDGVTFDEAWPNHLITQIDDISTHALGRDALLTNKQAAGRPKDIVDANWLQKTEKKSGNG